MFGLATILIFAYQAIARYFFKRVERVKTYTGDLFSKLNTGFFICLMFIVIAMNVGTKIISEKQGVTDLTIINLGFALLINLYAFWALIYGTALSFKPSVIGAYCTWAIGLVALFAQDFEKVMWLQALAVMAGYLIPGHLANYQFRKLRREEKATARV
jgi:hypothetical protein